MNLQIREAKIEESTAITELLRGTAKWIQEQGINQWQYLLEGGENEEIIRSIERNDTYVVLRNEDLIGTFTLYREQNEWDRQLWGEQPADSLYLHRLAFKPDEMGKGLGSSVFAWINKNLQSDKKYLRLDCVAHNQKLNEFYKRSGFEFLGITDDHSRYQKELLKESITC